MTVAQALTHPTATVVQLVQMTAGMWCRAWVVDGTYTNTYKVQTSFTDKDGKTQRATVTDVLWNLSTSLTAQTSVAAVDGAAGSWHHDGTYLWVRPLTGSIFDATVQAILTFYFADKQKTLNSIYWPARLLSAPSVSQRIEAVFGDVGQVGGGTMDFVNVDGYFDRLEDLQWDSGTVTLKIGVDLKSGDMAWADYETLATWLIEDWQNDGSTFQVKLVEPKSRVKAKVPFDTFSRADYPNIDDDTVGKPIPMAYGQNYGVSPVLIDPGLKKFKVAGHKIKSFDGLKLRKTRAETVTRSTSTLDWLGYTSTVMRFYIAGETIKVVTFKGTVLTEKNDIADVTSTVSTWAYVENYVYVNPPSGQDWSAGTVTIESEISTPQFITANFASVDADNGEFTLGDDWSVGIDVAVDFRGKVNADGVYLENAVDIIEDLLTVAGETNLDTAAFATAREKLIIGTDEWNDEVNILRPSLYITDETDILDIISDINKVARSFVFSDATGQYSIGIFEPQPGESLPLVDDLQIFSFQRTFDTQKIITGIINSYQNRPVEDFAQTETLTSAARAYVHNQTQAVKESVELPVAFQSDAALWNQAYLILAGSPLAKHEIVVAWQQFQLKPGDQVMFSSEDRNINEVMEVLESRLDLGAKTVTLILGNLRGFEDQSGFWVGNSDVLPSRFASLAGYSAGALTWNASWDDEIAAWARQNVGYWCDANGFASSSDPRSFLGSVWVA